MALRADRCICLRRIEFSETSQVLALLGRQHGLFRVIVKGAHRRTKAGASRFDGGVDLLDEGDAVMTDPAERELAILTEWKLTDGHLELRRDLRPIYLGLYAAEWISLLLQENDAHPEVFDLLAWLLRQLPTLHAEESFVAFELELLRASGFLPELAACVQCGRSTERQGQVVFSPGAGGVICDNCPPPAGPRFVTDGRILRMAQTILRLPKIEGIPQKLPRLNRHQTDPINLLLARYVRQIVGRDLRVATYILPQTTKTHSNTDERR